MADPSPCPFLNQLVRAGDIDPHQPSCARLVEVASSKYGVDARTMRILAHGARDEGTDYVTLNKFLRPSVFPVHQGALARRDGLLAVVDETRLQMLETHFSTWGRVSKAQLYAFQRSCWRLSPGMRSRDKVPALFEIELLWHLLSGSEENGTVPLRLLMSFLRGSAVSIHPRGRLSLAALVWRVLRNAYKLCPCWS
jgi:hypothetical protein